MAHWSSRYVGMAYSDTDFDCATLAKTVLRERFGRDIALPEARDHHGLAGPHKLRAMTAQIERQRADYARPLDRLPAEGDCVLLRSRSHLAHIGIYCLIGGDAWVLHAASAQRQVVLSRVREIERHGLLIEGFYEWI